MVPLRLWSLLGGRQTQAQGIFLESPIANQFYS